MAELRYSDSDLQEFEALIHERLPARKKTWTSCNAPVAQRRQQHRGHRAYLQNDGRRAETMSRGKRPSWRAASSSSLQNALLRIKNKTYGVPVQKDRFPRSASVWGPATLSIEAKQRQ